MAEPFPSILSDLHELEFDDADGDGIEFEPYAEFMSEEETTDWIRAWTGNQNLSGSEYRIFGQDGTGGYAAFWLATDGNPLLEQPVVFFGSEGAVGVIADDFSDYLWLLAAGIGPMEAVEYGAAHGSADAAFAAFAAEHATGAKTTTTFSSSPSSSCTVAGASNAHQARG